MRHAVLVAALAATFPVSAAGEVAARAFEILRANCFQCHSKGLRMAGLDLTGRDAALKGGQRGAALVPGDPASSRIIQAVLRKGALAMPPAKPLAQDEIETLRRWVSDGAGWPASTEPVAPQSNWWAFKKPVRPVVPRSGDTWPRNEIDEFVVTKLRENKLKPSAEAGRATLIRRLYFDLTGLPPTAAEVRAFSEERAPDAYEKLVEQLLASPRYGEKWGRHWLELVRYSDTAGFEIDPYIADAWRYRDYVIQSFNDDKAYDRFIQEQLAGDEFFPEDATAQTGTGYYCVGPNRDMYPDQSDINREETLTDYVDTTASVFLGLTAGCARCHDHKFDPISQLDYYRVRALFAPAVKTRVWLSRLASLGYEVAENVREIKLRELGDQIRTAQGRCRTQVFEQKLKPLPEDAQEALRLEDMQRNARQRELATQYAAHGRVNDDEVRACMTPEETARLHQVERQLVSLFSDYRAKPFACGVADIGNVSPKTFLPARGSRPAQEVEPGFFSILGGGEVPPPPDKRETSGPIPLNLTTFRRATLARWIASPENPLTARVMVNRIWQYHFGRGIVATTSDFGTRGRLPTHPELLDWLATEFVARGWSVKKLHRLILNSATYRQASVPSGEAARNDPENLWLSHFSRRRLNADELRDSALAATSALNPAAGGRPVVPALGREELQNLSQRPDSAWVVTADVAEHNRRSIYMLQKRTFRIPMLEVFDAPESMLTCPRRETSTTALQSLTLLNGRFAVDAARTLAGRLAGQLDDDGALAVAAWEHVLARAPGVEERREALAFLTRQKENTGGRAGAAAELIRGLLNTNEFLYVD